MLLRSALSRCRSDWPCVVHHYRPSRLVRVREGEVVAVAAAAAAAVVVGRMVAVEVAVGAQAGQSLAGTVDSHWPP